MKVREKLLAGICILSLSASLPSCAVFNESKTTELSVFYASVSAPGESSIINDDNEIKALIEQKTGVKLEESWLDYNERPSMDVALQEMIDSDTLTDFIYAGDGFYTLYDAGKLIAWDEYLDKYPNIKALYTDAEWDLFRRDDGKIYSAGYLTNYNVKDTSTDFNGFAFWIQARVLEAYDYPEIKTLDEYFDILGRYSQDYPTMPDGSDVIPFTCYIENSWYSRWDFAPVLLDGYPVDCCIVNVDDGPLKPQVIDCNTTPTAEAYFRKLNEIYNNGLMDPDFATMTYDEYTAKLSTGCVLGIADQGWDFSNCLNDSFSEECQSTDGTTYHLDELGCEYVPLGLTIESGMEQRYFNNSRSYMIDGITVTTSCKDPDKAFAYLNDLLSLEIQELRFWGIEGVDYLVDEENGLFYRTEEMRANWSDPEYLSSHVCQYLYMPHSGGISRDGVNCIFPQEQPSEFLATLSEPLQNCFNAYGANNFVDFLDSELVYNYPWYMISTMHSTSSPFSDSEVVFDSWVNLNTVKETWLPTVVTSSDFDAAWSQYMEEYEAAEPSIYYDFVQTEVVGAAVADAVDRGWDGESYMPTI